jgi:DNA-directed RNA polymerase subunit RPC12/RpoP
VLLPKIVMDYECGTCGKVFPAGWRARENHCRATGHEPPDFECERCPRWFRSWQACFQHMSAKNHFALECHICDETWPTEEDRTTHENEDHYYCADCDSTFRNYNNIKMVSISLLLSSVVWTLG